MEKSNHTISLRNFPTEILLIIFWDFDIPTLLDVCNVCKRFQQVGVKVLSKKFKVPGIGLKLTFGQERRRFHVLFKFSEFDEEKEKFIFKPMQIADQLTSTPMRFIHSSVVGSPVLSKISVEGLCCNGFRNAPFLSTHLSSLRVRRLEENFLQKPLTLNIKPSRENLRQVQYVYRMGHGTANLRIPYALKYSVNDTPPLSMKNTRGGERWLTLLSFECDPSFFYPSEPIVHRLVTNMLRRRRRNSLSQQTFIVFREVEDFTLVEIATSDEVETSEKHRWSKGARR